MAVPFDTPVLCPVVIGRAPHLAALHSVIDRAQHGSGQVLLLSGEAGVGKSRLVAEARDYAVSHGFRLLQGNCFEPDTAYPYAPLLDLLRARFTGDATATIAADVGPVARDLYQLLPELVPVTQDLLLLAPLEPEQEKRRLFAALVEFFLQQAARQPVLLVVEDLHWSDDLSLEFLQYLARRVAPHPLAMLLTYRSDEVQPRLRHVLAQLDRERLAQEVTLTPLTREEVGAMLRATFALERPLRAEFLEAIYSLTEGNPFFVEEVLKSLVAAGQIFYTDGGWDRKPLDELHIPRSVQDAVQQRVEHLSMDAQQVLQLAAVAGRRFDFGLLQHLTRFDEQELLGLIKELIAAQLVVEESAEQFAFRHALTRQAIYTNLLARERQALHRQIAETLEQLYADARDAPLGDIAYHFYEAGRWDQALEYSRRAGDRSQALYAPRAAIQHFTHALDASRHLATGGRGALLRQRGQAYEILGDFESARSDYEATLELAHAADDRAAEWQALLALGMLWAGRDYARTGDYYRRALELARAMDDPVALAHSLNRVGNWHLNREQPVEARRYHQEALHIFQARNDPRGTAEALDLLGMATYLSCDLIQGTAYYEQAVILFRELNDRQGLASSLATLTLRGATYQTDTMVCMATDIAEAARDGELALKIARDNGLRAAEAYALAMLGFCLGTEGDYARALEMARAALAVAEEIEHRQWMVAGHCALGAIYLDLLALPAAQRHLEQALSLAHAIGSWHWIRAATGFLAPVYLLQHQAARAQSILDAALGTDTPVHTLGQRLAYCALTEVALARGDAGRALEIVDRLVASAPHVDSQRPILRLSKLRGEALHALHRVAEAEAAFRAAEEAARAQGARPLLGRIHLALANLLRAAGRRAEAEREIFAARTLIEELATNVPDEPVASLGASSLRDNFLRQATARLPHMPALSPRRAAKEAWGGLTSREREVAAQIAQGKSNREIAGMLVVTERTIETHVGNILSKLCFTSRAQIAAWAVETGLVETAG